MTVYDRETVENLDGSLDSIVKQTRLPQKIILVKDGPLPDSLDELIEGYSRRYPDLFQIIALTENLGRVAALNTGLDRCEGEYTFIMDSDDLSVSDRFEKQLSFMQQHPEVGVLSSAMAEFETDSANPDRIKTAVADHDAIAKQFPWRNPINNPACCYRTQLVKQAGGYPDLKYLEDYYLYAKLLCRGIRFHNLTEPLLLFRFSAATLSRRSGWINFRNECWLRWFLYQNGQSTFTVMLLAMLIQLPLRFGPAWFQTALWRITRKRISG